MNQHEDEKYTYVPCTCACHRSGDGDFWMAHMVACCEGGYIKIPKKSVDSNPLRSGQNEKTDGI